MKQLTLFSVQLLSSLLLFSQSNFHCDYDPMQQQTENFFTQNKGNNLCMANGNAHTPKGVLNTMMVFVTFTEDQNNTNAENNIYFWPKNSVPNYATNVLNLGPNPGSVSSKSNNLTGYYETMSGYNGTNGFSVTGKVFHVTISKQFNYDNNKSKLENLENFENTLCQRSINALQTQYPNEDWSQYDKRDNINRSGNRGTRTFETDNSALYSDGVIDYFSIHFRLLPSDLNIYRTGQGAIRRNGRSYFAYMKSILGLPDLTKNNQNFWIDCGHTLFDPFDFPKFFPYFTHEFGHGVFGLAHHMGANDVTGFYFNSYYGWGMMADVSKFFNTSNAWENWTYGWSNPQIATPNIQTYSIKDFVTTKDAIKIPIPNTSQALWIENHQLINFFDNKNTTNIGNMTPGLYMYISDYESPENCVLVPSSARYYEDIPYSRMLFWANRLKVLSKEGNKDYIYTATGTNTFNFTTIADNPISGAHSAQSLRIDMNKDAVIDYKSATANDGSNEHTRVYNLNNSNVANWSGNSSSAFGVGDELSISGLLPILNYPFIDNEQDRLTVIENNNTPNNPIQTI